MTKTESENAHENRLELLDDYRSYIKELVEERGAIMEDVYELDKEIDETKRLINNVMLKDSLEYVR